VAITASELRANVYRVLDEVLASGIPVEINRGGRQLRIVPVDAPDRLNRLVRRSEIVVGDSEDFVHLDWSGEWNP
jgi:prevent-host-death family protein